MASATPALLSANEVRVVYGHQQLLSEATLAVAAGEKVGLVGRNGSGKTTLLKILSNKQEADSGEVVGNYADGMPGVLKFSLPKTARAFTVEVAGNRIDQKLF